MTNAQISKVMAQIGRKGGKIGGKRRMETMTPEERSERALVAAKARWAKETDLILGGEPIFASCGFLNMILFNHFAQNHARHPDMHAEILCQLFER